MIKKLITVFIVLISFVSCGQDKEKIFTYMVGETEEVTVKYIDTIDKINEIKVSVVISTNQISIRRSEEVFRINNGKLIKYSYYLDNLVSIDAEATEDYIEGQDYHEIREKNEIIVKFDNKEKIKTTKYLDNSKKEMMNEYKGLKIILNAKEDKIKEIINTYTMCNGESTECYVEPS